MSSHGVGRILEIGEKERGDGTGSMPAEGHTAGHQTADLASAAGSGGYDADSIAQGSADSDGMAGQPHA